MFPLNSATFTHFLQKQWEKDKHGKLWPLAKGYNLELSVCLYIYNKWHLHSSPAFLYAHSSDSPIPGLQQSSNKQNHKSNQRDWTRWIWKGTGHLQLGASITSAALSTYSALCWDPVASHQKIQKTKRIAATCRWVRNSPEVSEWKFNSSENSTTFIKWNHVQEGCLGMFPRRYFSVPCTRNSQPLVAFWFPELQPHAVSQAGRGLEGLQAQTPACSTVICEITPLGPMQMLFANFQEGRSHSCLSKQPLKLKYSQEKNFSSLNLPHFNYMIAFLILLPQCFCGEPGSVLPIPYRYPGAALCSPSWAIPAPLGCPPRLGCIPDHPEGPSAPAVSRFYSSEGFYSAEGTITSQSALMHNTWAARCQQLPHPSLLWLLHLNFSLSGH